MSENSNRGCPPTPCLTPTVVSPEATQTMYKIWRYNT